MFALSRMIIRAGVLAALIATVLSVSSALAVQGEWEAIEAHAASTVDWLAELLGRIGDFDPSIGEITLSDLTSPQGWADLGAGLFGSGEQVPGVDSFNEAIDIARLVGDSAEDLTPAEIVHAKRLGLELGTLPLDGSDLAELMGVETLGLGED